MGAVDQSRETGVIAFLLPIYVNFPTIGLILAQFRNGGASEELK